MAWMICSDCELVDGEIQQMVHEGEKKKKMKMQP